MEAEGEWLSKKTEIDYQDRRINQMKMKAQWVREKEKKSKKKVEIKIV